MECRRAPASGVNKRLNWYTLPPTYLWPLYLRIVKTSKFKTLPLVMMLQATWLVGCANTSTTPSHTAPVNDLKPKPTVTKPAEETAESFPLTDGATSTTDVSAELASEAQTQAPAVEELTPEQQDLSSQQALLQQAKDSIATDANRALAISYQLRSSSFAEIRQPNQLLLLQALVAAKQAKATSQLLASMQLADVPEADRAAFCALAVQHFHGLQNGIEALNWLMQMDILLGNNTQDGAHREQLWQQLVQLSGAEVAEIGTPEHPRAQAWLELLQIAQTFAGDPTSMQQALGDWQQRHPEMPAMSDMPADIKALSQTPAFQPKRIGVLLPLSGQYKSLGQSVQLGMIAAAKKDQTLLFVDSSLPAAELQAKLTAGNVEFVVGPLLKEDIDKVQTLQSWSWPTLFLNNKGEQAAKPDQFYFALAWEDEAQQMLQFFQQRQFDHPVLIYGVNPIHQRMAQHFQQQWQQRTGKTVETYSFANQDQLQGLIKQFLETAASQERITEMNRLTGQNVQAEEHSRSDIDAIYLIADPVQTRMFKPFIDVTVSPGSKGMPIYTSSRSHSLKVDKNDQRDLAGLTMTEMPWLLPQASTATPLRAEYDQAFPEQDETIQRLFAMGFDALSLIQHLQQQKQFPLLAYNGLTGSLRLKDGVSIQRQLTLAQYRRGKLLLIEKSEQRN